MKDIELENKLCQFIAGFANDLCSLELLLFFGRHPNASFNRTALIHVLTSRRFDTNIALRKLIEQKLVTPHNENGVTLYRLTREESLRDLVTSLVNVGQSQWEAILEKILDEQGIV